MSSRPDLVIENLPEADQAEFKRLTRAPRLSWPTVLMLAALTLTFVPMYVLCVSGLIPLWIGAMVNSVVGYMGFSIVHDAIHRSVSSNARLNDALGQFGMLLILPFVDVRLFRWLHILHHRHTSDSKDPDRFFNGAWWTLPFRWMFIDGWYLIYGLRHADKVSRPYMTKTLRNFSLFAVFIAWAVWAGYGMEVLMLWVIPTRVILLCLGFSFFWLPHVPHDTTQAENFTRATAVREGHFWLMRPLLQYQHVHLVHHMYPATPFFNNERVYRLIEPELRKKDLAVQHGFSIHPTIYPGRA